MMDNTLIFLDFATSDFLGIGEVFVDGQNRNVWCGSMRPITDIKMYHDPPHLIDPAYSTIPSRYFLIYSQSPSLG